MDNHFGKGLMAGLNAENADSARSVAHFARIINAVLYWGFHIECLKKQAIDSSARGKRAS